MTLRLGSTLRRGNGILRRAAAILLTAAATLGANACSAAPQSAHASASNAVAACGDWSIDAARIGMFADGLSNGVLQTFAADHGIDSYGSDIWTRSFDGQSPIDALSDAVQSALADDCATLAAARSLGVDTGDVTGVPSEASGGPLDAYSAWTASLATLADDMREAILTTDKPSEEALRDAFSRIDPELLGADASFEAIRVAGSEIPADTSALAAAAASGSLDDAVAAVQRLLPNASASALTLDSQSVSKEDTEAQRLLGLLGGSQPGAIVRDDADDSEAGSVWLIVHAASGGGTLTFEQAPRLARVQYANERLASITDSCRDASPLRVDQPIREVVAQHMTA